MSILKSVYYNNILEIYSKDTHNARQRTELKMADNLTVKLCQNDHYNLRYSINELRSCINRV